jgi:hypothetical protein
MKSLKEGTMASASASASMSASLLHVGEPTQDQTQGNCTSQFLGYQGKYTSRVEISGRGVPERYSTSCIAFYNCSA